MTRKRHNSLPQRALPWLLFVCCLTPGCKETRVVVPIIKASALGPAPPGPGVHVPAKPGAEAPPKLHKPAPRVPGDGPGTMPLASDRWTEPLEVAGVSGGPHRPRVAVNKKGGLHVVHRVQRGSAVVVAYRQGPTGDALGPPVPISQLSGRNMGADLVLGPDGMPWVCYDHAKSDSTMDVLLTRKTPEGWTMPRRVSQKKNAETSDTHLAFGPRGALTLAWLSRPARQAKGNPSVLRRTRSAAGKWGPVITVHSGQLAMHPVLEGGPGGLMALGFDTEPSPEHRRVQVVVPLGGKVAALGEAALSAEWPGFAFAGRKVVHATWTLILRHARVGVFHAVGRVAAGGTTWGAPRRITRGVRGRHYDPALASNRRGEVMVVWAWSAAGKSALLSSLVVKGKPSPPGSIKELRGAASLPSVAAGPDGRFHVVWSQGERDQEAIYYSATKLK